MREGFVPTLDALAQIFFADSYQDADGNKCRLRLSLVDAMGHRTAEVYELCRRHRGQVMPLQGRDNRQQVPVRYIKIKTYPGTRRRIRAPGTFTARRPAPGPGITRLNTGTRKKVYGSAGRI